MQQPTGRQRARVDDVARVDVQIVDRLHIAAIVERAGQRERKIVTDVELVVGRHREITLQIHVGIVRCTVRAAALERRSRYCQVMRGADLPVRVRDRAARRHVHVAARVRDVADLPATVVQGRPLNVEACAAQLAALGVGNRRRADRHVTVTGDRAHAGHAARVAVGDLAAALHGHLAGTKIGNRTVSVVDRCRLDAKRARVTRRLLAGLNMSTLVHQRAAVRQRQ
ncbi:Uncharacterised protein [Burkholderia pseudomallei]|nr:Uncharacterised protein [Burkholderia pseudomallei]